MSENRDGLFSSPLPTILNHAGIPTLSFPGTSYGITSTGEHQSLSATIWIESINDTSVVENVTLVIKNPDGETVATVTWEGGTLPTTPQTITLEVNTVYTIEVWIKGASTVAPVEVVVKLGT